MVKEPPPRFGMQNLITAWHKLTQALQKFCLIVCAKMITEWQQ